jgi:hypothetical protein
MGHQVSLRMAFESARHRLSIVRTIAARIGADVELGDAAPHSLEVTVTPKRTCP